MSNSAKLVRKTRSKIKNMIVYLKISGGHLLVQVISRYYRPILNYERSLGHPYHDKIFNYYRPRNWVVQNTKIQS